MSWRGILFVLAWLVLVVTIIWYGGMVLFTGNGYWHPMLVLYSILSVGYLSYTYGQRNMLRVVHREFVPAQVLIDNGYPESFVRLCMGQTSRKFPFCSISETELVRDLFKDNDVKSTPNVSDPNDEDDWDDYDDLGLSDYSEPPPPPNVDNK